MTYRIRARLHSRLEANGVQDTAYVSPCGEYALDVTDWRSFKLYYLVPPWMPVVSRLGAWIRTERVTRGEKWQSVNHAVRVSLSGRQVGISIGGYTYVYLVQ